MFSETIWSKLVNVRSSFGSSDSRNLEPHGNTAGFWSCCLFFLCCHIHYSRLRQLPASSTTLWCPKSQLSWWPLRTTRGTRSSCGRPSGLSTGKSSRASYLSWRRAHMKTSTWIRRFSWVSIEHESVLSVIGYVYKFPAKTSRPNWYIS